MDPNARATITQAFPAGAAAWPPPPCPRDWNPLSYAIALALSGGYETATP